MDITWTDGQADSYIPLKTLSARVQLPFYFLLGNLDGIFVQIINFFLLLL